MSEQIVQIPEAPAEGKMDVYPVYEYLTEALGLHTEEECFDAIMFLTEQKRKIQNEIVAAYKVKAPRHVIEALMEEMKESHRKCSHIVNDVCKRFKVIRPEMIDIPPELLKTHQKYWDWYDSIAKKKHLVTTSSKIPWSDKFKIVGSARET